MAFNGSGVFSRLYSWVTDRDAGTKILATRHDAEDDGFAAAINDIVDGTQGFIGPVRGTNGTAASPAFAFTDDTDSGVYRVSANVLGFAVNGTQEMKVEAGYVDAVNGLKIDGTVQNIVNYDQHATLAAGYDSGIEDLGTVSSGTVTPEVDGDTKTNFKKLTNDGAFTLAPPSTSSNCRIFLLVTNAASAGAITTSAFDGIIGSYATVNGAEYIFVILKIDGKSFLEIKKPA